MFYSNDSLVKEVALSAEMKESIISFILLPHDTNKSRTQCIFMTEEASENTLSVIGPYLGW